MFFFTPTQAARFLPNAYNSFADDFSQTRKNGWSEFEDLFEGVEIENNTDQIIADIGCGNGRLYEFFAEKKQKGCYVGVDIAENFLQIAEKNISYSEDFNEGKTLNAHFKKGHFLSLPFEKNSVDQVWAIASFHHLATHKARKKSLEKIWNILKPDGKIFFTVWNLWEQKKYIPQKNQAKRRSILNPFFSDRDFLIPWGTKKIPRYYYSFSPKYLEELLHEEGFEIEKKFFSSQQRNFCVRAKKIQEKKFFVQNIPFQKTNFSQALEKIISWSKNSKNLKKIYTPNPEMLVECKKNKNFKKILQSSSLSLADGNGILWASGIKEIQQKNFLVKWIFGIFSLFQFGFFRKNFPKEMEKTICGSDILKKFLETTKNDEKIRIFLLGGSQGSAKILEKKYSTIVGVFDGKVEAKNFPNIFKKIQEKNPNAIFVALGAPKQENFIHELEKTGKFSGVAMGVGGSFDFLSGHQKRAPKKIRTLGLEWLFRLFREPSRAKRIWNATGKFIYNSLSKA